MVTDLVKENPLNSNDSAVAVIIPMVTKTSPKCENLTYLDLIIFSSM